MLWLHMSADTMPQQILYWLLDSLHISNLCLGTICDGPACCTGASNANLCTLAESLRSCTEMFCREALIQELRGSMHGLLDAFNGNLSQQAEHYERRMRQLQTNLQAQPTSLSLPETPQHSGALKLTG